LRRYGDGPFVMRAPRRRAAVLRGLAFGVTFEVRVDDERLLPRLRERFPPGWVKTGRPPDVVVSLRRGSGARPAGSGQKAPSRRAPGDLARRTHQVTHEVFDTSQADTSKAPGKATNFEMSDTSSGAAGRATNDAVSNDEMSDTSGTSSAVRPEGKESVTVRSQAGRVSGARF